MCRWLSFITLCLLSVGVFLISALIYLFIMLLLVVPLILATREVFDGLGNFDCLRFYLEVFTAAIFLDIS